MMCVNIKNHKNNTFWNPLDSLKPKQWKLERPLLYPQVILHGSHTNHLNQMKVKKIEHYLLHEKNTCLGRLLFRTASSQVVYNLLKFFCHSAKLHSIQFKNQFETCMHHILYPPKLQFNSWLGLTGIWHTCAKKIVAMFINGWLAEFTPYFL